MNEFPHLSKAPIVETILDFRVSLSPAFAIETLKTAEARMPDGYSLVKTHRGWLGEITVAPEQSPQQAVQDLGVTGYAFHSSDNKYIVQFRRDGFSFSRLAPYTAWEDVSEKTVGFWRLYLETAEPIEVTRLAVRTINRIALLEGVFELGCYLTAPPAIPPGLPNRLLSFLSQNLVQDEETGIVANVIQTIEAPDAGGKRAIILDSDVFLERKFEPADKQLLENFDTLRRLKNLIFFNSLTPETIDRYK